MKVLVAGATGATGRHVVCQLLKEGVEVKVIVRDKKRLPDVTGYDNLLTVVEDEILKIPEKELIDLVSDCDAVVSCLGHNISLKGLYGKPRKLVRDAVIKLSDAIKCSESISPTKFILMNTTANRNRDLQEKRTIGEIIIFGLIGLLLPPHSDNVTAAEYLRSKIGQNDKKIEWIAVRPDSLIDSSEVTDYEAHPSPLRSAVFNPGKTSRINVANFMVRLIKDNVSWNSWRGKMPVIYNKE